MIAGVENNYVYLASPYSHPMLSVRVARFMEAQKAVVFFFHQDIAIYSPIVHWHNISVNHELPMELEHWKVQNDAMLLSCNVVAFLHIKGLHESKGVRYEYKRAEDAGKLIWDVYPEVIEGQSSYRITAT